MGEFIEEELKKGLEKEEDNEKPKRGFSFKGGKIYLLAGGGAVFLVLALLGSGMLGKQEVIMSSSDVQVVNRIIEEQLSAQREMNKKLLEEIRQLRKELQRAKESVAPSSEVKSGKEQKKDIFSLLKDQRKKKKRASEQEGEEARLRKLEQKLRELERERTRRRKPTELRLEFQEREVKATTKKLSKTRKPETPKVFVPAGTVLKGKVVSGFFAPVGGEKKFPAVLIKLEGSATAPNGFRIPLDKCRVIAKAEGDWVLERAMLQTYKLACVLPSGKTIEVRFNASVVSGVDGMDGIKGRFVNASAKQLQTFFGATFLGTLFDSLASAQVRTELAAQGGVVLKSEVIENESQYAFYRALADTWKQFSSFYIEQAKQALPVVLVNGNVPVFLKVIDGFSLEVEPSQLLLPDGRSL